jgi:hypothetical protein
MLPVRFDFHRKWECRGRMVPGLAMCIPEAFSFSHQQAQDPELYARGLRLNVGGNRRNSGS